MLISAGDYTTQRLAGLDHSVPAQSGMGFSERCGSVDYAKQAHGQIGATTVTIDENAIQARLGANIKARREKLGLAQTTLGERSGVHRTYINQLENGHKNVTVVVLSRLADTLGTTPSALTRGILNEEHRDDVQD